MAVSFLTPLLWGARDRHRLLLNMYQFLVDRKPKICSEVDRQVTTDDFILIQAGRDREYEVEP